jgi:hypothetical protein
MNEEIKSTLKDLYINTIFKLLDIIKDYRPLDDIIRRFSHEHESMGDMFKRLSFEQVIQVFNILRNCKFREDPNSIVRELNNKIKSLKK